MSSSKGLEWEKVWIIDVEANRSPSKITNKAFKEYLEGEQDEEFEASLEGFDEEVKDMFYRTNYDHMMHRKSEAMAEAAE